MNLLVAPIEKRFDPVFHTTDLTSKEMDRICDGIEVSTVLPSSLMIRCLRVYSIPLILARYL